jgi:hypothetical protein
VGRRRASNAPPIAEAFDDLVETARRSLSIPLSPGWNGSPTASRFLKQKS